jgi:hypothetical protein
MHLEAMKKTALGVAFFILLSSILPAQGQAYRSRPVHNLALNFLGDISLVSIHYENVLEFSPTFFLTGKLGVGYNSDLDPTGFMGYEVVETFTTIPHHLTLNVGQRIHFFEFGLGGTFLLGEFCQGYDLYPIVGYRIYPLRTNRFNFRVFLLYPLTGLGWDIGVVSPVGLSTGFCF